MAKEVWEKVKESETQASKIIEEAKLQSITVINKAREEAVELLRDVETKAARDGETALADTVQKSQGFAEKRLQELRNEQQLLTKLGEARISGAVNFILEKVVR